MSEAVAPEPSWSSVLGALVAGDDLDQSTSAWAMERILSGEATPAQIAGFAVALRAKGETLAEINGLVEAMYAHAKPLDAGRRVVDIVGTGGDQAKTVNVSTMSAVVVAGAGVPVVKHGNRAQSSSSGSADVLEALGVGLDVPVDRLVDVLDAANITFCFAMLFHASLRFAGPVRRELAIPTPFNLLGPLTNPARPAAMAVGVADRRKAPLIAGVLAERGTEALVFSGDDGLDELTITTSSRVWAAGDGHVRESTIDPRDFGFTLSAPSALAGGDPAFNAGVFRDVLGGAAGAPRDAVLLNAGAAIAAFDGFGDDVPSALEAGIERARASIDSRAAAGVLDRWVAATSRLA